MPRSKQTKQEKPKAAAKKSSKKEEKPEVVKPVEVVVEKVVEPVEVDEVMLISKDFSNFLEKLQQVNTLLSSLKTEFRALEKKTTREFKVVQKQNAKRKRKQGNRSPSGFVKPTLISHELADFLKKSHGSEMARTEVTREINAYIREHKLQDKENGRKINADKKLTSLLKLKKEDELTYFNLQKYMSHHFAKAGQPLVNPV
jgi:chromatin remodeling complex protein RSC6